MGSRRSTTSQKKSKERFKTLKAKRMTTVKFLKSGGLGTCLAELKATKKALDASQTKIQELQNAHRRTTNALQELQNAHQRTINALWDAEDRVEELENHEVESISTLHRQIRKLRCNGKSNSKKSEKLITFVLQLT
ncbi:hypothetical protein GLOIN_2v1485542 [Rhizophagus irregularis DAOM 181602=DAOM 197198]|nr:hypothetical protein GLOIN_2v1485542 [Rhizophagus irregularis DAOM 181602=DAOM 197198]